MLTLLQQKLSSARITFEMMKDELLKWSMSGSIQLLHTPVFSVNAQKETSATGIEGEYVAMTAPDWVVIVAVLNGSFVMVRQWRHGEDRLTTEFPGGVLNENEDPAAAAERELLEETGFKAGKLTHLGSCSPNPALFKNHFHCYLAEELEETGEQHLDSDELLNYMLCPISDVIASFGSGEYSHAFTGTALAFYLRYIGCVPQKGK